MLCKVVHFSLNNDDSAYNLAGPNIMKGAQRKGSRHQYFSATDMWNALLALMFYYHTLQAFKWRKTYICITGHTCIICMLPVPASFPVKCGFIQLWNCKITQYM